MSDVLPSLSPEPLLDLLARVRQCQACQLDLPLGARPLLQAHPAARILIASQAPGRRAHSSGIPFDDSSGDRLRKWLGVTPATFYDATKFAIMPMGFCYPGTGASGDFAPRPQCAELWRHGLLQALPDLELILLIGQYAQAWHLGARRKASLTTTVADWRSFWPDVLPMPHPSARNRVWLTRNPWFEEDVVPVLKLRIANMLG